MRTKATHHKIQPLDDGVLVEHDLNPPSSSVLLPTAASTRALVRGSVVAVGPGRVLESGRRLKPDVRIGDQIIYERDTGREITLDGHTFLLMRERDVLARVH